MRLVPTGLLQKRYLTRGVENVLISLLLDPEVEELSNDGSIKLKALAGGKVASEQREQTMKVNINLFALSSYSLSSPEFLNDSNTGF